MISRLLRIVAVSALIVVTTGTAASAQKPPTYPPEALSVAVVACTATEIAVSVDGAQPNSALTIVIDYQNAPDVVSEGVTNDLGFWTNTYSIPAGSGSTFTITITGLDFDPNNPAGIPFKTVLPVDRTLCPDLPNTGSDALPVGKIALGASLAGAFLIVIALRRRPRDADAAS